MGWCISTNTALQHSKIADAACMSLTAVASGNAAFEPLAVFTDVGSLIRNKTGANVQRNNQQ